MKYIMDNVGKNNCGQYFFLENITPIYFLGKEIMTYADMSEYRLPQNIEIEPAKGEHDYNTCEGCQKNFKHNTQSLEDHYNSLKGFPNCCEWHRRLAEFDLFDRKNFDSTPLWTAKKIMYTKQQIINCINLDTWYKDITDYIEYTIYTFGAFPYTHRSQPLYLHHYLNITLSAIKQFDDVDSKRRNKLIEYLNNITSPQIKKNNTNINVLVQIYEKWYKIFPFDLNNYFGSLREQFKKSIPIFLKCENVNKYTGIAKVTRHSKESLINLLLETTNSLLSKFNAYTLFEKGLITDTNKTRLDLLNAERRMKLEQGYINNSPNEEHRYRNILKEWFKDEKEYLEQLKEITKDDHNLLNKQPKLDTSIPTLTTFSRSFTKEEQDSLYNGLIKHGFIANTTTQHHFYFVFGSTPIQLSEAPFERITWIKPTERVKSSTSRKSFFNLLNLLQISYAEISNSELLNSLFVMRTGRKLTTTNKNDAQNDNFISEYNELLVKIANKGQ